jgi:hypothetical protein
MLEWIAAVASPGDQAGRWTMDEGVLFFLFLFPLMSAGIVVACRLRVGDSEQRGAQKLLTDLTAVIADRPG